MSGTEHTSIAVWKKIDQIATKSQPGFEPGSFCSDCSQKMQMHTPCYQGTFTLHWHSKLGSNQLANLAKRLTEPLLWPSLESNQSSAVTFKSRSTNVGRRTPRATRSHSLEFVSSTHITLPTQGGKKKSFQCPSMTQPGIEPGLSTYIWNLYDVVKADAHHRATGFCLLSLVHWKWVKRNGLVA
jgi:hypothetical protein